MAHFTLRLPEDLQADIDKLSEEHDRSVHAEVIQAIKAWIDHYRTCSECSDPADVFCQICQPPTWFCRYHYTQRHLPEEERDDEESSINVT